ASCCCDRSVAPSISCRPTSSPTRTLRCSSRARARSSMRLDRARRAAAVARRAGALAAIALLQFAVASEAALPAPVAKAFAQAGVPLDALGVVVQEIGQPRPLVAHLADRPYSPASVMKLVTTFAALELLGPDYRWKTDS